MLDPFIADTLYIPPPPPSAFSNRQRSWDYAEVAKLETDIEAAPVDRSRVVDEWLLRIAEIIKAGEKWAENARATAEDMASIGNLIEDMEATATSFSRNMERMGRKHEKDLRPLRRISVDRSAMFARMWKKGEEIDGRQLRGYVDFAWAVRGIRALMAPDKGSGPVFDDANDLEHYLASIG